MSWKLSPPECERPTTSFARRIRSNSLGLESLDVLEIILDLEQRFDIEIPYNANTKLEFDTVGELVQAIERLIAEKAGSK